MTWFRTQFPTFKLLFDAWRDNFTVCGRTITCVMVLCIPALATLDSPLFLLFSVLLSMLLLAGVTGYWFRPQLTVRVVTPTECVQGESLDLVVRLTNETSTFAPDLTIEAVDLPTSWKGVCTGRRVGQLAAGRSARAILTVHAMKRGTFKLPNVRVTSTFPLNLFHFHRVFSSRGALVVLPAYRPLARHDIARAASGFSGEQQTKVAVGYSGEYLGSREYLPGMPVRRWDHSSSARLGQPVIREFTDSKYPTAAILADTHFATPSRDAAVRLEATISLAAALSEALTSENYRIVLFASAEGVEDLANQGRADQHKAIMRSLADLGASRDDRQLWSSSNGIHSVSGVVFVLVNRWDDERERLYKAMTLGGGSLKRIFIGCEAVENAEPLPGDMIVSVEEIQQGTVVIE